MREILFRGKRKANNEWIEGGYAEYDGAVYIVTRLKAEVGETAIALAEIDPATVGQYTGLKDRNGQRIFEGDILRNEENVVYSGSYTAEVVFEDGEFQALGNVVDFDAGDFPYVWVIGNIRDNPELMEDAQ